VVSPLSPHRRGFDTSWRANRDANLATSWGDTETDEAFAAVRRNCWDAALQSFATSYIFERRARDLGIKLNWITYVGFIVPMIVSLLVLSYGHFDSLPTIITVASALGVGQVVVSLWSVVGDWVTRYSYATDSAAANSGLARKYEELASSPPDDISAMRYECEKLAIRDEDRQSRDYQQGVRESEKRMGMRAALRKYQRECAGCGEVPITMKATSCGVCGNFSYHVR